MSATAQPCPNCYGLVEPEDQSAHDRLYHGKPRNVFEALRDFWKCVENGGHTWGKDLCTNCGAEKSAPTLAELFIKEIRARR